MEHPPQSSYVEGQLPVLVKVSDQEPGDLLPETLTLDGQSIVSTTAPTTTLYTLQHNILDPKSTRMRSILLRRTEASFPPGVKLYNLTFAPPEPESKPECYLAANDMLNVTAGNIALQRPIDPSSGKSKTQLQAKLNPGQFWHHDVKFVEHPKPLVEMKRTAHGYDYYDTNLHPVPIAREDVNEDGERQLKILMMMDRLHRDILVALWCLGLWRRMVRAQARVRAKRLKREKKLIKGRTARAERCLEELIRRGKAKQVMVEAGVLEYLAEDLYTYVR